MVPDKLKKISKLISSKEHKEALYYIESLLQTEPNSFFIHYLVPGIISRISLIQLIKNDTDT